MYLGLVILNKVASKLFNIDQACTTYGPRAECGSRKLLNWPAYPKILYFKDVFLINVPLKGLKSTLIWPFVWQKISNPKKWPNHYDCHYPKKVEKYFTKKYSKMCIQFNAINNNILLTAMPCSWQLINPTRSKSQETEEALLGLTTILTDWIPIALKGFWVSGSITVKVKLLMSETNGNHCIELLGLVPLSDVTF